MHFQFVAFCEKLARAMKLDEIADDVGLDVNGDALLARGEQLAKLEVFLFTQTFATGRFFDWFPLICMILLYLFSEIIIITIITYYYNYYYYYLLL